MESHSPILLPCWTKLHTGKALFILLWEIPIAQVLFTISRTFLDYLKHHFRRIANKFALNTKRTIPNHYNSRNNHTAGKNTRNAPIIISAQAPLNLEALLLFLSFHRWWSDDECPGNIILGSTISIKCKMHPGLIHNEFHPHLIHIRIRSFGRRGRSRSCWNSFNNIIRHERDLLAIWGGRVMIPWTAELEELGRKLLNKCSNMRFREIGRATTHMSRVDGG